MPSSKLVAGVGPLRRALQATYPQAQFLGTQGSDALAVHYASADGLVIPSRTDAFGMVLLDMDLCAACVAALEIPRGKTRAHAVTFTWAENARQLLRNTLLAKRCAPR